MQFSTAVEEINEPIKVLASFDAGRLRLHTFLWNDRIYKVDRFNLLHISKDGAGQRYHYCVSSAGSDYQLRFNPIDLEWRLEKVCTG